MNYIVTLCPLNERIRQGIMALSIGKSLAALRLDTVFFTFMLLILKYLQYCFLS